MEHIYLFTGSELGERSNAVAKVKKELKKTYGDVDMHSLYADSTNISQVLSILQTQNLFMNAVCVLLNNAEEIKNKDDVQKIVNWAKDAKEEPSFLILTSDSISINKTIENAIPKANKQIFWELFEGKKKDWIRSFFAKENMSITPSAIDAILALVENNTDALKTSCSHLAVFFDKGKEINEEDIEKLISHTKEETAFSLFDAILHLNLQQSFSIAQKLMQVKNSSPIQIIAGLSYCFRRLIDWHNAVIEAGGIDELSLKKKGFTSKTAINQYKLASKNFSLKETRAILAEMHRHDYEMRVGGGALQGLLLDKLIYTIIVKRGKAMETYHSSIYGAL